MSKSKTEFYDTDTSGVPKHLRRNDWATKDSFWYGRVEGNDLGTPLTILFFSTDKIGGGPPLHVHKYDEVFIIRSGRAQFTVGDEKFIAEKGDVVFGPANIPHKFENLGPGMLETTDLHMSDHFEQVNLE
ncbi:cupin domain-containing protein [Pseudovibrio sp. Ad37]|uniref:cupin domain-containing protein n=1 Tax=Pseudovibrio sp. Ad37 TaxID=989422 RepID=UPI0007AEAB12|nr:cupin domain-containing protein [Pseudovibrio sp. Ad37]KZL26169.1 Cupin domain protein [Pseudovibrio sp. Ad37]